MTIPASQEEIRWIQFPDNFISVVMYVRHPEWYCNTYRAMTCLDSKMEGYNLWLFELQVHRLSLKKFKVSLKSLSMVTEKAIRHLMNCQCLFIGITVYQQGNYM